MKIVNENFIIENDILENGSFIRYKGEETSKVKVPFLSFSDVDKILCSYRRYNHFGIGITANNFSEIPYETQWLGLKHKDGSYTVLYALCEEPLRFAFYGIDENTLGIYGETNDTEAKATDKIAVYYAKGTNIYTLLDNAPESIALKLKTCRVKEDKKIPEFMQYFGWCTWDSFYEHVSEEKVEAGLESFKKGGFVPRFLLLDDGWQTVCDKYEDRGHHKLSSLKPNEKFGGDLTSVIKTAKEEYGVKQFYVWHALLGYWGGIETNSEEMAKYNPRIVNMKYSDEMKAVQDNVGEIPVGVPSEDKIFEFYCDYHRKLSMAGVDGVKIDVQFNAEAIGEGSGGRVKMARLYREAIEASTNLHFNGGLINCMPGSNDLTYHTKASNVTRTSCDFFPQDDSSHGKHIFSNAVNSLWIGGFTWCDWDMFQTKHKFGAFHAASRAVSGSPIYVSDKVDEHDYDIINKLITSDGKLLLPKKIARPTEDSLFISNDYDEIFKIFNYNKFGGVIAAFNLTDKDEVMAKAVKPSDIDGYNDGKYAVYSHVTDKYYLLDANEEIKTSLKGVEYDIFTVVPIVSGRAVIGLTDKYNSGGAVVSAENHGDSMYIILTGGGNVSVYSDKKPVSVMVDGKETEFTYTESIIKFTFENDDETEVEIKW